uniref:Bm9257 n=1 Tax=Brugia malayi TaxID=6279 RepID=A0A0J9XR96_BRUMA|nr:Bm9257 [Brugia malayi]
MADDNNLRPTDNEQQNDSSDKPGNDNEDEIEVLKSDNSEENSDENLICDETKKLRKNFLSLKIFSRKFNALRQRSQSYSILQSDQPTTSSNSTSKNLFNFKSLRNRFAHLRKILNLKHLSNSKTKHHESLEKLTELKHSSNSKSSTDSESSPTNFERSTDVTQSKVVDLMHTEGHFENLSNLQQSETNLEQSITLECSIDPENSGDQTEYSANTMQLEKELRQYSVDPENSGSQTEYSANTMQLEEELRQYSIDPENSGSQTEYSTNSMQLGESMHSSEQSENSSNSSNLSSFKYSTNSEQSFRSGKLPDSSYLTTSQYLTSMIHSPNSQHLANPEQTTNLEHLSNAENPANLGHSAELEHSGIPEQSIPLHHLTNSMIAANSDVAQNLMNQKFSSSSLSQEGGNFDGQSRILIDSNDQTTRMQLISDKSDSAEIDDNNSKVTISANANANKLATIECDDSLIVNDESYLEYFICSQCSPSNSEGSQQLPEMRTASQESLIRHFVIDEIFSTSTTSNTDNENDNNHINNNNENGH